MTHGAALEEPDAHRADAGTTARKVDERRRAAR